MHGKATGSPYSEKSEYLEIFERYHNALVLYAERYLRCREESLSVVQDVFVDFWEMKGTVRNENAVRNYLYAVTHNKAVSLVRKKQSVNNYTASARSELGLSHYEERFAFIDEETFRLLFNEVDKLPGNQKQVVILALDNKSNYEIAELLNISVNTVKFHKKNAYKALRDKISDHYFLSILF